MGILDTATNFFTGGGEYADPNALDPVYNVPKSMVRDAQWNTIGNISATLLAAGMRMTPAQRAQILMQGLSNAGSRQTTDLYNAQLMRSKGEEVLQQAEERKRQREVLAQVRSNPEAYGLTPDQAKLIGPSNIEDIVRSQIGGKDLKSVDLGDKVVFVDSAGRVRNTMMKTEKPQITYTDIGTDNYGNPIKGAVRVGPNGVELLPLKPPGAAPSPGAAEPQQSAPQPSGPQASGPAPASAPAPQPAPTGPVVETVDGRTVAIPPGIPQKVFREEVAKENAKAVLNAPKAFDNLATAYRNIEELEKQPGIGGFLGATGLAGGITSQIRGTDAYKAQARIDQLVGSTFLQAYESLKGGGAITQPEGEKAQAAIARLGKPGVGEEEYRQALRDFKEAVVSGMAKLKRVRGMEDQRYAVPSMPPRTDAAPSRADLEAEMRRRGLKQ